MIVVSDVDCSVFKIWVSDEKHMIDDRVIQSISINQWNQVDGFN